ncbi:MAG: hypothetical protein ACXW2F_11190, partial [Thermoanaerobaculia bacterium]
MVKFMAAMGKSMSGDKSPVTKADIDKAKADFKKQQSAKKTDPKETKEDLSKKLPPGIKLLDASVKEGDLSVTSTFKFAFDHLNRLAGLKMPSKDSKDGSPADKNMLEQPFAGLELIENGDTITIRTKPANPAEKVQADAKEQSPGKMDPEMEKMMRDAFKKMRIAYRITAPFTIVSSNAMRKEGNTLIWEYGYDQLEKLGKSDAKVDNLVQVVYKK